MTGINHVDKQPLSNGCKTLVSFPKKKFICPSKQITKVDNGGSGDEVSLNYNLPKPSIK